MIATPITKESAIHMAKYVCLHEANTNKNLGIIKAMALRTAAQGDGLKEIFDKLYDMGFVVSADQSLPHIRQYFNQGVLIEKK
jgi:hypothetical protein